MSLLDLLLELEDLVPEEERDEELLLCTVPDDEDLDEPLLLFTVALLDPELEDPERTLLEFPLEEELRVGVEILVPEFLIELLPESFERTLDLPLVTPVELLLLSLVLLTTPDPEEFERPVFLTVPDPLFVVLVRSTEELPPSEPLLLPVVLAVEEPLFVFVPVLRTVPVDLPVLVPFVLPV